MILIDGLEELKGKSGLFSARVVLSEEQREPVYRMLTVTYGLKFEGCEAWLSQPVQEIVLSHHVGRPDLATLVREPDGSEKSLLTAFMSRALGLTPEAEHLLNAVKEGIEEQQVFDPDNFYPPTTAPDKLRLRILQVLDETREKLGRYPHELLKIERMIGREEVRQFLYAYGGGERFCEREKEMLLEKGYALDEACHHVY